MHLHLIIGLIPLFSTFTIGVEVCQDQEPTDAYKNFGTKTTYEQARLELAEEPEWVPGSKYTPLFAYGFIRHGIRYPDEQDIIDMKALIADHEFPTDMDNESCPKDQWPLMKMEPEDDNHVTVTGGVEVESMARRFAKRLPGLFHRPELIEMGTSDKIRTTETAQHFFKGLLQVTSTNATFNPQLHPVTQFQDQCKSLFGGKLSTKAKQQALDNFETRSDIQALLARVQARLPGIEISLKRVLLIDKACAEQLAVYQKWAPICSVFSRQDRELLDLWADIDDYYGDAHGANKVVRRMPCQVIKDFLDEFDETEISIEKKNQIQVSKPVVLRFSHAGAIKPLVSYLGIGEEKKGYDPATILPHHHRHWRSSRLAPFGANVWFVVLTKDKKLEKLQKKSKKGKAKELDENDLIVATLVQERLVKLDGCDDELCKLKQFRKRTKKATGKQGCDLSEICVRTI